MKMTIVEFFWYISLYIDYNDWETIDWSWSISCLVLIGACW